MSCHGKIAAIRMIAVKNQPDAVISMVMFCVNVISRTSASSTTHCFLEVKKKTRRRRKT